MNDPLKLIDFIAISPILILLTTTLILILIESFAEKISGKYASILTTMALLLALAMVLSAPSSVNPMLTAWIKFDAFAHFFSIFFLILGIAITLISTTLFQSFSASHGEYFFLLLSALIGLLLIGVAADFLILFLGIEILSIASYVLCGYMKKWQHSSEAAIKYFLTGSLATAFLLYGIALIYGAIGNTYFGNLLTSYHALDPNTQLIFLSGIAFLTLGLCFKAAIVPFHMWAPDAYSGSPTPVTAFMAIGTKTAAFAAFARLFLVELVNFNPLWNQAIAILAYPTLVYANIVAIRQTQLRRFFAYSGISHAGFMLLTLAASSPEALDALKFYLIIYAIATMGAFAVLAFIDQRPEGVMLHDLEGLFYHSPWLACVLTVSLLTLAGIPPTAGFFAKFYVLKVAFKAGYHTLVILGLSMSIIAAYYYLRIIAIILTAKSNQAIIAIASWPAAIVGIISFAAIIIIACYPQILLPVN